MVYSSQQLDSILYGSKRPILARAVDFCDGHKICGCVMFDLIAKTCTSNLSSISGYNSNTMIPIPPRYTVGTMIKTVCKSGFFRYSELSYATTVAVSISKVNRVPINVINCSGTAANDGDPDRFEAMWIPSTFNPSIEDCQPVYCGVATGVVSNVEMQPNVSSDLTKFPYGYHLTVKCMLGFVNYKNESSVMSAITCAQDRNDLAKGIWEPSDYLACIDVRCNSTDMYMFAPNDGKVRNAVHRLTGRVFSEYEQNRFNIFNHIVFVVCKKGFIFPDRLFEKKVLCDLKTDSNIEGEWKGYQGTLLPISKECQSVTCKYQDVIISNKFFFKETFRIIYNGFTENKMAHNGSDYPYLTQISFSCIPGYKTIYGTLEFVTTCEQEGEWTPKLVQCVEETDNTSSLAGTNRHYIPKAQEAKSSESVGLVAMIIMILFFTLVLILDLAKINSDFQLLRDNVRNLRLHFKLKQKKRK